MHPGHVETYLSNHTLLLCGVIGGPCMKTFFKKVTGWEYDSLDFYNKTFDLQIVLQLCFKKWRALTATIQ